MATDTNIEQTILNAAKTVFVAKGYAGARMQEIADKAGINKALLHYYFRSKDDLFLKILSGAFETLVPLMNSLFVSNKNFFDTLEAFVDVYIDFLLAHPYLPAFIIHELNQHPDKIPQLVKNMEKRPDPMAFLQKMQQEVNAGKIRHIDPLHFLVNIIALCVFPFVARPMVQSMLGIPAESYDTFLQQRKKEVVQTIFSSIKTR